MTNNLTILNTDTIKNKIYTIRGIQVMLDKDLAELYEVETKQINRAVKRNKERFPDTFCFRLSDKEYSSLKSESITLNDHSSRFQFDTSSDNLLRFQNGTLKVGRGKHRKYLPYVFTEQGIAMLSGVLQSDTAIRVSIQVMTAFVVMRKFLASNAQIFQRIETVEKRQIEYKMDSDEKFEKVFDAIEDKTFKRKQGIFFDGQIFDAYVFVSDLIRSANASIILIDNYVDDSVLTLFNKRKNNVQVTIFTKEITKQLLLDLEKYNSQYPHITLKGFKQSHDRFLIIDDKQVYHIGASLKDLGKKWFGFSKFDREALKIIEKIEK